jgi:hypothetical protein
MSAHATTRCPDVRWFRVDDDTAGDALTFDDATRLDDVGDDISSELSSDYPERAMAWIAAIPWVGPMRAPIACVDYSGAAGWRASDPDEADKVDKFAKRIASGWEKPVLLLRRPDAELLMVVDGHHRALAYQKLGKPLLAYIGETTEQTGPWDEFHSFQREKADKDRVRFELAAGVPPPVATRADACATRADAASVAVVSDPAMKRVIRIDAGTLRSPTRTPQGFLRADGYVGRPGIYEYTNDDGTVRRELRLPEEVFKQKALDGFEGAPLTDGHPLEPVTAANVRSYEMGTATSPGRRDGDNVAVPMMWKDPGTIRKIESGKVQLSPGYALDLEMRAGRAPQYAYDGNPDGRYDAIQRNIEINHIALVDSARGGSNMRLRMDGFDVAVARADWSPVGGGPVDANEPSEEKRDMQDISDIPKPDTNGGAGQGGGLSGNGMGGERAEDNYDDVDYNDDSELAAAARNKLPEDKFAVPDKRKLPIHDEKHVRAAMSRFSSTEGLTPEERAAAAKKIVAAAKSHGIAASGFEKEYVHDSGNTRGDAHVANTDEAIRSLEAQRINLDMKVKELDTEVAKQKLRADTAEGQLAEVKKQIPVLSAQLENARKASETASVQKERTRADAAEQLVRTMSETRNAEIRARVVLERAAAVTLGDTFRMDSLPDRDIKCLVLKKLDAGADISAAVPDGVIHGRFLAACERRDENARSLAQVSQILATNTDAGAQKTPGQVEADNNRTAWTKPLPNSREARAQK